MGCCCVKGSSHLHKYFNVRCEYTVTDIREIDTMVKCYKRNEEIAELYAQLRPIIEDAFDAHSKNSTVLEEKEGRAFVEHYAAGLMEFTRKVKRSEAQNFPDDPSLERMRDEIEKLQRAVEAGCNGANIQRMIDEKQKKMQAKQKSIIAERKEQAKEAEKETDQVMKKIRDDYLQNKTECVNKAFDLLDENRDGKLVKEVVVAALLPYNEMNDNLENCFPTNVENFAATARAIMSKSNRAAEPQDNSSLQAMVNTQC